MRDSSRKASRKPHRFELQNREPVFLRAKALTELAEEVAQTVFIEFARQTLQLPPNIVLAARLYQITRRRAIDAVRREAGRRLREQAAQELQATNATAEDWTHVEPLLDDAMDALERNRSPVPFHRPRIARSVKV